MVLGKPSRAHFTVDIFGTQSYSAMHKIHKEVRAMRQEPRHILDVPETQKEQGRKDVQQQLMSGKLKFPEPCHVIVGAPKTDEEGYVGIYVEPLMSSR